MNYENPKMNMTLPRLSVIELRSLINHAGRKLDDGDQIDNTFLHWLADVCQAELIRREMPGCEAEMIDIPATLRPIQIASFLQGVFTLSRSMLTPAQGAFIDELELHVICHTVSALQAIEQVWEPIS